jgi:antitoxin YefM
MAVGSCSAVNESPRGRLDAHGLDVILSSMTAISYTAARENLASTMDRVCADHAPVVITRNRDRSVVMLSLEDYQSLEETAYLTRSPLNAKRLLDAIHALEGGLGVEKEIDLEA